LIEVVSIKFTDNGKIYFFNPRELTLSRGDHAVVETSKGMAYGECVYGNHEVDEQIVIPPLRPVIRRATPMDDSRATHNRDRSAEDLRLCQQKIDEFRLPMKLISSERSFDGSLITFYFSSGGRVDFRELVRELTQTFRDVSQSLALRVKLTQVGVRDEAKLVGGLGVCGRAFCCTQFLGEFHPVSIKMAKTQGLSLNPVKISGTCGKLMCCLKYEEEAYEDLVTLAPKMDSFVETPFGKGSVVGVNLLRGIAKVRLEDGGDTTLKSVPFAELEVLGGKARRAEYQAAKEAGNLEEAGFKPSVIRKPAPLVIPDILPELQGSGATRAGSAQRSASGGGKNQQPKRNGGGGNRRVTKNQDKHEPAATPTAAPAAAPAAPRTPAPRPEPVRKQHGRRAPDKRRDEV
jgi:cell fate regulator YaaT (PSP1 superfamily)